MILLNILLFENPTHKQCVERGTKVQYNGIFDELHGELRQFFAEHFCLLVIESQAILLKNESDFKIEHRDRVNNGYRTRKEQRNENEHKHLGKLLAYFNLWPGVQSTQIALQKFSGVRFVFFISVGGALPTSVFQSTETLLKHARQVAEFRGEDFAEESETKLRPHCQIPIVRKSTCFIQKQNDSCVHTRLHKHILEDQKVFHASIILIFEFRELHENDRRQKVNYRNRGGNRILRQFIKNEAFDHPVKAFAPSFCNFYEQQK